MSPIEPLVWVDDVYDAVHASDGASRFGTYLQRRFHLVTIDDSGAAPGRVEYATAAWGVGSEPVMSPGYVRYGSCVHGVVCRGGVDFAGLVAEVVLRLDWSDGFVGAGELSGWRGWDEPATYGQGPRQLVDPPDGRPALLMAARLEVPIVETVLPAPGVEVDVEVAKQTVRLFCDWVNPVAGPVAALLQRTGGGGR